MTAATSANKAIRQALEAGEGVLRLAPTWVPRVFLQPGGRLKLHPRDLYPYGAHRGGIDERWLASTTPAMNEDRTPDEGLSYVVSGNDRFTLKDAVEAEGPRIVGPSIWETYRRWPVLSKFFDNAGPIMHHLHQDDRQANLVGREGKPEGYYFPPQLNFDVGNFPLTFFGLEPGTTREDIRGCLARWDEGDNGILDFSKAYRLRPGTGWLIPPRVLHAPGSLLTYEPQWGSDVLAMFQSMVEGRRVPRNLLTQDVPEDKHQDLDFLVDLIDWTANLDPEFKKHRYLEPIPVSDSASEGYIDKWIVYGKIDGRQKFSARELTLFPGARCVIRDAGASGAVVVQGRGRIARLEAESPALIRFGQMTQDEFFISHEAAIQGVAFENLSQNDPLVILRYFGPDVHDDMPDVGSRTG